MTGGRTLTLNQAIANAVVRTHRKVVGRGRTEARAFFRVTPVAG